MAYNATYDSSDIAPIVIDGISAFAIVFVGLASLIGIIILYVWLRKKMK